MQLVIDANMWEYKFCRKQQVVTMTVSNKVIINNEAVQIDAHLLFERLTFISTAMDALSEDLFRYELCAYPPALFDTSVLPELANKASLAKAIWSLVRETQVTAVNNAQFVLDGGALLHRVPWCLGKLLSDICNSYVTYALHKYGNAVIVFDGYSDTATTKDATHIRRCGRSVGPVVQCMPTLQYNKRKIVSLKTAPTSSVS